MQRRRFFPAILMSLILVISLLPTNLGTAAPAPAWIPLSKPLSLEGRGTIELKAVYAVPNAEGRMVSFTIDVKNQSSGMIDFYYYWIRLQSKSGARFPINMVDPGRTRVYPGQTETFLFYSQLPAGVKVEDLLVKLIKWDFNAPDFERQIATFPIHTPTIPLLGKSVTKAIPLTHNALIAKVEHGGEVNKEGSKEVTLIISLINKGYQPLPFPNYQFIGVTDKGYAYPFTMKDAAPPGGGTPKADTGEMLLPLMEKKVSLTGLLPSGADINRISLFLLQTYGEDQGNAVVPLTVFRTFAGTSAPPVDDGVSIPFGTAYALPLGSNGKGTITFDQVQRLPWSDKDLLSARFTIQNTGNTPFTLPAFEGSAFLSGGTYAGEVIPSTKESLLNPGASVSYTLSAPFPYHAIFHDGSVQLKEKVGEGGKRLLLSNLPKFSFIEGNLEMSLIPTDKEALFGEPGNQRAVKIADARTYITLNGVIMTSRVEVKNLERRGISFTKMTAFFQDDTGGLYPAKIDEVTNIMPGGSGVITISAEMPEGTKTETTRLLIGESIEDKGVSNAVTFALPKEILSPTGNLNNIPVYPYTFQFLQTSSDIGYTGTIRIKKESGVTANFGNRRIIFEFSSDVNNSNVDKTETFTFDGILPSEKIVLGSYQFVNVYDEFEGGRRLIGIRSLRSLHK